MPAGLSFGAKCQGGRLTVLVLPLDVAALLSMCSPSNSLSSALTIWSKVPDFSMRGNSRNSFGSLSKAECIGSALHETVTHAVAERSPHRAGRSRGLPHLPDRSQAIR